MAIHSTQAHLVRRYIRAADCQRIARLLDRLPVESLADLFAQLNERDMRRIASAVCSASEATNTATAYVDEALLILLEVAEEEDAIRLVSHLARGRASHIIRRLDEARAHALLGALAEQPADGTAAAEQPRLQNILRMRRLFV